MLVSLGQFLALTLADAVCLFFLLVRWRLLLPLFNAPVSLLRRRLRWNHQKLEDSGASQTALNVRFLRARGWERAAHAATSALLAAAALGASLCLPWWAPVAIVLSHGALDVLSVLYSAGPAADVCWQADRHGVPCGLQQTRQPRHVVFSGGVCLANYVVGVLDFCFERYGTECFRTCDFAGASSGSWAAGCAVLAAHGAGTVRDLFDMGFVGSASLCDLFPFGVLWIGCLALEEFTEVLMRHARLQAPEAFAAVAHDGRLAIWLFGFSLRRSQAPGRAYRLMVREGPDFQDPKGLGALLAATSTFPYFTSPRLCGTLRCLPAAMDGYFPGRGFSALPVPDLTLPRAGPVLLFDMSGGLAAAYAGDREVHVLDITSWEAFSFWDITASSSERVQGLFERGRVSAERRKAELDVAMRGVFGVEPRRGAALDAGG